MLINSISALSLHSLYKTYSKPSQSNLLNQPCFDIVSFKSKEIDPRVFDDYKTYNNFGVDYTIFAHNKDISGRLQREYSSASFKKLFDFAKDSRNQILIK